MKVPEGNFRWAQKHAEHHLLSPTWGVIGPRWSWVPNSKHVQTPTELCRHPLVDPNMAVLMVWPTEIVRTGGSIPWFPLVSPKRCWKTFPKMSWMMSPPQLPGRYFFYLFGRCLSALNQDCSTPFWLCGEGNGWQENPPKFDFRTKFPWRILPYLPMFFPQISHGISIFSHVFSPYFTWDFPGHIWWHRSGQAPAPSLRRMLTTGPRAPRPKVSTFGMAMRPNRNDQNTSNWDSTSKNRIKTTISCGFIGDIIGYMLY